MVSHLVISTHGLHDNTQDRVPIVSQSIPHSMAQPFTRRTDQDLFELAPMNSLAQTCTYGPAVDKR